MAKRSNCAMCEAILPPHGFHIVRIDVFAEPSVPPVSGDELEEMDTQATIARLIRQLERMDPGEAQDQVHRRFQYLICADCQKAMLANPLGKPRRTREGAN
jgi:hypothetical protein